MKIITDCHVHLLSEPIIHSHPEYLLPPDGTDAERIIAMGGKVCYDTYGTEGNPVVNHVKNLVSQEHFSVIEHVNIGLLIAGVSRALTHELVRHRHFSYSQRSTRYTAEEGAAIVLEPYLAHLYVERLADPDMLTMEEHRMLDIYLRAAEEALNAYRYMVEALMAKGPIGASARDTRKWARGKARQRLPHDLETRVVMTGNLRAWREFLVKRTSRHAEPEIRRLADRIFGVIRHVAPAAFDGLKYEVIDGYVEMT